MQQPTPDLTPVPALSPTEFLRKWVTAAAEPAETVGTPTMPAGGTVGFRHSPARTVIRHNYLLDISHDRVPSQAVVGCALDLEPDHTFEVNTVVVEVSAKGQTVLGVTLHGSLIIDTNHGPMVSSHPRARWFSYYPTGPGFGIGDLPDWVSPMLQDAVARTREAFA